MKRTEQRTAIERELRESGQALSAQQLHDRLDGVGLATIYRNLKRLADDGTADTIRKLNGEISFRICGVGHHHHLTCSSCGKVVEVRDCALEQWAGKLATAHGFHSVQHETELHGVCGACAGN